jgi:hypothetical protein
MPPNVGLGGSHHNVVEVKLAPPASPRMLVRQSVGLAPPQGNDPRTDWAGWLGFDMIDGLNQLPDSLRVAGIFEVGRL